MDECHGIDLELEADGLIDDKQFPENSVGFNLHEPNGGLSTEQEVDNSLCNEEDDDLPELRESMEPGRKKKTGRYNLRKSLAWDSAFFTSAGVLDAEELSTMITGADKCERHLLPGIQEDITESTESLSSLGSDSLTMETHEEDLFVDIRASIQRSSKMASNLRISNNKKAAAVEVDSAAISSLKKEEPVTQNKNPKSGLKNTSSLQPVRMSKFQPKQNTGKLESGKTIKQETAHSQAKQTSVSKLGQANSILPKPPKVISSSIPSSTAAGKRESVGTSRAKSANGISNPATVSGKATQPPKVSSLGVSRRALPKSALSSNSSLLASSTTSSVHSTRSSTSSDGSSIASSKINPVKPNLLTARRSAGKSGDVGTGPTGSIPKTPSRATVKNKLQSSSTRLGYQMPAKIPSSVSPASSVSDWSSVSSSSSSIAIPKFSNSRTSLDTSSCRSMEGDVIPSELRKISAGRTADGHENQGASLTGNNSKRSSMQTGGSIHAPSKPSGLRMPSHKFGFFDGGKSSARSPNTHQQSPTAAHNGIPKNGPAAGMPVRSSNSKSKTSIKASSPKPVTTRMATSPASIKPISSPKPNFLTSIKAGSPKPVSPESIKPSSPNPTSSAIIKPPSPASTKLSSPKLTLKPNSPKPTTPAIINPSSPKPTSLEIIKPGSPKPTPLEIIKPGSPKPTSPTPFQEKSHVFVNASIFPTYVTNSPTLSVGVKDGASKETCQDTEKVEQVVADIDAIIESLGDLKINIQPVVEQSNALGDDVAVEKNHLQKDSDPVFDEDNSDDKGTYHRVNGLTGELLIDTSGCETIASETAACRAPLSLKNYFISEECSDMPKELVSQVVEKTGFLLAASEQKENS